MAQDGTAPNVVVATGTADRWTMADSATAFVSVSAKSESASEAKTLAQGKAGRVVASLQKVVPDSKSYEVLSPFANPEYAQQVAFNPGTSGGFAPAPSITGYLGGVSVRVRIENLSSLDAFVKAANGLEDARLGEVRFVLRDPAALRKAAIGDAFEDARRKAQETAESIGKHLGDVYRIDAGEGATITEPTLSTRSIDGQSIDRTKYQVGSHAKVVVQFRLTK